MCISVDVSICAFLPTYVEIETLTQEFTFQGTHTSQWLNKI